MDLTKAVEISQRYVSLAARDMSDDNGEFSVDLLMDSMAVVLVETANIASKVDDEFKETIADFIDTLKIAVDIMLNKFKDLN